MDDTPAGRTPVQVRKAVASRGRLPFDLRSSHGGWRPYGGGRVLANHVGHGRGQNSSETSGQVLITRVGLRLPDCLPYEGWEKAGRRLSLVADSSAWCLGDWLIWGRDRYADRYQFAISKLGLDYQTLRNYAWVARKFDVSRRRDGLSFQHHAETAAMPPDQQDHWLDQAERFGWTRRQLRQRIRGPAEPASTQRWTHLPQIEVDRSRLGRWRVAAQTANRALDEWIIASLDTAATSLLGQPHGEGNGSR